MKNSKDIYELLNDIDFNIEDYEKEKLTDMEKKRLKNDIRKNIDTKHRFKNLATTAAVLILSVSILSQTSFGRDVYAATQSKVSEISYSIGKALGIEKDIKPYASVVGKTKEDNGIEVKLGEVIVDKDRLSFNLIFNTMEPVEDAWFENISVFINGEKMDHAESGQNTRALDETNTLFSNLCYYKVDGIEQMEDIEIGLLLEDLYYFNGELEEGELEGVDLGKWDFEFTANGKELAISTQSLAIDYVFNIDNQRYELNELEYNPIRQTIKGKRKIFGEYGENHFIQLRGHDNLNNDIIFFIESIDQDEVVFSYERIYDFQEDWSDEITSITLTPYILDHPETKQVGEEFTIFLNK